MTSPQALDDLPEPPRGAPWDVAWRECPRVLFDCEMTGTDPARDAIVEVALTRVEGGAVTERLVSLVHTDVASTPEALAVHGIDPAALEGAPTFADLAPAVAAMLEGAVPVAHDPSLDRAFLDAAFAAAGSDARLGAAIDTLHLSRRAVLARSYQLGALCAGLGFAPRRWHRAGEDVKGLEDLFGAMVEVFQPESARDLWQVRAGGGGPAVVRDTVARALEAMVGSRRLATLLVRTPGHVPTEVRARVERWATPHVWLTTPGRNTVRVLRADRVLRVMGG